jgi:hypothetical protein
MDIAKYIRIFDKMPSDDLVEKRRHAVDAVAARYQKLKSVSDLLQLSADLTRGVAKAGTLPEARIVEVEECIKVKSTSFIREGEGLQLLTCALLAALKTVSESKPTTEGGWSRADVIGLGLWSGLGFQPARTEEKLEALRMELLNASRNLVIASSENARKRKVVPAIGAEMPAEYEATGVATSIQSNVATTIDALRLNAALDREEIDLLWWIVTGWSRLANAQFASMDKTAAVVIAGLEAGALLRRIPGEAHKHIILRLITDDREVTAKDVITSLTDHRTRLVEFFRNASLLSGRESAFPLVAACISEAAVSKASGARSFKLSDWGARALLESSILHVGALPQNLL